MADVSTAPDQRFYLANFMDLTAYRLERADFSDPAERDKWHRFVEASEQGTLFAHPDYLAGINQPLGVWYCYKNQDVKAAVALVEDERGSATTLHEFVIHNGIMFAPPHLNQNQAQVISEQFRCTCFIVQALAERYEQIQMSLSPYFSDIRPFLWHNYGQPNQPQYRVEVRFTTFVNIEGVTTATADNTSLLFSELSRSRRQEIRYGVKKGVKTVEQFCPELFLTFYQKTLGKQAIEVAPCFLKELEQLITHLNAVDLARMFVSYTPQGQPGSIAIFGLDQKRAYYLFGANDPDLSDNHTGTAVLWDAFQALNESGVREVDLEGINSPLRGYFKLSFGGTVTPYYHLFLDKST